LVRDDAPAAAAEPNPKVVEADGGDTDKPVEINDGEQVDGGVVLLPLNGQDPGPESEFNPVLPLLLLLLLLLVVVALLLLLLLLLFMKLVILL
jgi:hypothetical protein